jgi:hypothetical protein
MTPTSLSEEFCTCKDSKKHPHGSFPNECLCCHDATCEFCRELYQ